MKKLIVLAFLITYTACEKVEPKKNHTGDLDFLIGSWERTNETEGKQTFEHWSILSKLEYIGHGYTLKNKDTVFQEHMRLFKKDSSWTLEIAGPNEIPTQFKLTNYTLNSFVAENPKNEFPTKISYSYFDDTITAVVSNDEMEIPFIFWRVKE